jgi:hypothetical protein
MSFLQNFTLFNRVSDEIKKFIFGPNNENLDEILDRFYSIRQERRARLISYIISTYVILLLCMVTAYLYGLHRLQTKLDSSVEYLNELASIYNEYISTETSYMSIMKSLQTSSHGTSELAQVLAQKAQELGVDIQDIPPNLPAIDLPSSSPLSKSLRMARIDVKLNSVSIKKMMDYINAIQTMPQKFKVSSLEIKQMTDTKLYFNVNMIAEGYIPIEKGQE